MITRVPINEPVIETKREGINMKKINETVYSAEQSVEKTTLTRIEKNSEYGDFSITYIGKFDKEKAKEKINTYYNKAQIFIE